jgi:hypothetical protein
MKNKLKQPSQAIYGDQEKRQAYSQGGIQAPIDKGHKEQKEPSPAEKSE